jgi:hypothetical protein
MNLKHLIDLIPDRPTPTSRMAGALLVLSGFLLLLGFVGWVEGL